MIKIDVNNVIQLNVQLVLNKLITVLYSVILIVKNATLKISVQNVKMESI